MERRPRVNSTRHIIFPIFFEDQDGLDLWGRWNGYEPY